MTILKNTVIFDNATASEEKVYSVIKSDLLELKVNGTGEFNIKIEVNTNFANEEEWYEVGVISDKNFEVLEAITKAGLYKIDLSGFAKYKIILNITSGMVNCSGNEVLL